MSIRMWNPASFICLVNYTFFRIGGGGLSTVCLFQIRVVKSGSHPVDFAFGNTMMGGFSAPFRRSTTDLFGYFARLGSAQFKILRYIHRQREGGRAVVFI